MFLKQFLRDSFYSDGLRISIQKMVEGISENKLLIGIQQQSNKALQLNLDDYGLLSLRAGFTFHVLLHQNQSL